MNFIALEAEGRSSGAFRRLLARPFVLTTLLLWVFGFVSLGTQLLIVQYLPTLLQLPVPGLRLFRAARLLRSTDLPAF